MSESESEPETLAEADARLQADNAFWERMFQLLDEHDFVTR